MVNVYKSMRDVALHCRDGLLKRVLELHRSCDSLQYSLILYRGEDRYCLNMAKIITEILDYIIKIKQI